MSGGRVICDCDVSLEFHSFISASWLHRQGTKKYSQNKELEFEILQFCTFIIVESIKASILNNNNPDSR